MNDARVPSSPLEKIALCCSGGGYRATSFHLGTMSYLHRIHYQGKPLLENVRMLSTVSGGTITGIVYTLQRQQGKTFPEIYEFLMDRLRTLDLVKLGIEKLNPGAPWTNTYKRKNLINAFAELYDEHFTGGATFAQFADMQCHLEAVAFNSTEFNNALDFRFRNRGTGYFGNYYLRVSPAQAAEVRLSDAIAASSCFPGGFEPILWPDDFRHADAPNLQALHQPPTGIMDGGIYDNQGIDTVLRYKESAEESYFDCIIISDVSSPNMNPFVPTRLKPKQGISKVTLGQAWQRAKNINRLINWLTPITALLLAALPLAWHYTNTIATGVCGMAAVALLILWVVKLIALRKLLRLPGRFKRWLLKKNPHMEFYVEKLSALDLSAVSFHRARPLLLDRLDSVLTLLFSVFLKVVRRLNYAFVYNDDRWGYRRIANLIHKLTPEDYGAPRTRERTTATATKSLFTGDYNRDIGPNIGAVAQAAAGFGTTLWFTPEDQLARTLDKLVATGQFTMCYNLIEYLEDLMYGEDNGFSELPAEKQAALRDLLGHCKTDWQAFKTDPFFMQH